MSSCDCLQNVTGTIVDKDTKQPLDSVYIKKTGYDYGDFTDNKGNFKLKYISGWCGCPPMKVTAVKDGYETTTSKIKNGGSKTIFLKRKK
jgi:hypothetical protein